MSTDTHAGYSGARFRFTDFIVVIICLFCSVYCLNLFRLDLLQTIEKQNEKPVGVIISKYNIVQRRIINRVLWDRLAVESPVYMGDLIRVAELSSATLTVYDNSIDLYENTLIRIQRVPVGGEILQIEMTEGNLCFTSGDDGGNIVFNLMGCMVEVGPDTVLNAEAGNEGMMIQVNEGFAQFIEDGNKRDVPTGSMVALNAEGTEMRVPGAVVRQPRPSARYLKNAEPFVIEFDWNRINLEPDDVLLLEIAVDRNFSRISHKIEVADSTAQLVLDAGLWHWRLSFKNTTLSTGRITVVDAAGLKLLSPINDSIIRYQSEQPSLRFQWSGIDEAMHYNLEISEKPDFSKLNININVAAAFNIQSGLDDGIWYWRVMPVFPPMYEGSSAYSAVSHFRIEQMELIGEHDIITEEQSIVLPDPEPEQEPLPPPPPPPVPAELALLSPASEAVLPGLTALRDQTEFRWDSDIPVESSRFVLSRNSNPLQGRPVTEITNPGRTFRLDRLEEGSWYWTVEARTADGLVSSAPPQQFQVLPIPLLPPPLNRMPVTGYRIGIEQIRNQRTVDFNWTAVQGANAYIFILYQLSENEKRQIIRTEPVNRTAYTLNNIAMLDSGIFYWQVEAVNVGRSGTIEQHGRPGESSFIVDIPVPGPVQMEQPGILYGW